MRYMIPCTLLTSMVALVACGDENPVDTDAALIEVDQTEFALGVASGVETIAVLPNASNDGVSVDRRGRIFVSNAGQFGATGLLGTEVYRITRYGKVATAIDGLNGPLGSVTDRRGNLYVSNFNDGTIIKRDRRGQTSIFATLNGSGGGLALDRRGRLYAASYTGQAIYRIERTGEVTLFSDDPLLAGPVGISLDRRGRLYVGNFDDAKVLRLSRDGAVTVVADLAEIAGGNIGYLTYSRGCIYATSLNVNMVFAVSPDGAVAALAGTGDFGSQDGSLATAQFALPNGIAAGRFGRRLFVSEYGSPNLRMIRLPRDRCAE